MISRKYGMAPAAFESFIKACGAAGVDPDRLSQTIGNAVASAGFHKQDGTLVVGGKRIPYCAATDIGDNGLSKAKIKTLLHELAKRGFVGWFRNWENNTHIHAVFCGLDMKESLFLQCVSFLNDRNGLSGDGKEYFYTAPPEYDRALARALKQANPILWDRYLSRIPKAYRDDAPPKLLINGKVVSGAYLTGGNWYCMESDLAAALGVAADNPNRIASVALMIKSFGWKIETYTGRLAQMNRADIAAVREKGE